MMNQNFLLMAVSICSDGTHRFRHCLEVNCKKYRNMPVALHNLKDYLVWVLALAVAIAAVPYIKRFVVFVLDELYDLFIQHNPDI